MTIREKLARAIYESEHRRCSHADPSWDNAPETQRSFFRTTADACLAVLRAEPVSEEACDAVYDAADDDPSTYLTRTDARKCATAALNARKP